MIHSFSIDSLKNRSQSAFLLVLAIVLAISTLAPILFSGNASAGQLSQRKITISSSELSDTGVTYAASFRVTATTVIRGLVVEICQNSPLIGDACTTTNGVTASPTTGTVTFTNAGSSGDATFEVHANSTATGRYIVTDADGATGGDGFTPVTGADFTFSYTVTNPSGTSGSAGTPGTFYARILTYAAAATASAYLPAAPGTTIDDGGIALSTARQLTVTGRVQERLVFCVFAQDDDTALPSDCTGAPTTTTIQLGNIDNAAIYTSPVQDTTSNGANDFYGLLMLNTNAAAGTAVSYYGDAAASGTNELRAFRVSGASCNASGTSTIDQCFISADDAAGETFSAGTERFGVQIPCIDDTQGTTDSFRSASGGTVTAKYSNTDNDWYTTQTDCENTAVDTGVKFAWNDNATADTMATVSSGNVIDDEIIKLRFGATAAATTPSGSYTALSTYIATATF